MQRKGKSGSDEMTDSSECRNDDRGSTKEQKIKAETHTGTSVNSVLIQKNARSFHSSDRFEKISKDLVGYKWMRFST